MYLHLNESPRYYISKAAVDFESMNLFLCIE